MQKVNDLSSLWGDILKRLEARISPYAFKNWFKENTGLRAAHADRLEITVPNDTYRNVIKNKFGEVLRRTCEETVGRPVTLEIASAGTAAVPAATIPDAGDTAPAVDDAPRVTASDRPLSQFNREVRRVTNEDVVVGPCNKIAMAAAESVIKGETGCPNPIFIYGEAGMGKTYLLQLIYTEIRRRRKGQRRVVFSSCEAFMNDFITSLQNRRVEKFRHYFRNADVFLLDDVHFLAGGDKTHTKEEFYHTLNELLDSGKQVVITCDKHPNTVKTLGPKLVKRLMAGMWIQLGRPCSETRIRILERVAGELKLAVDRPVLEYLAQEYEGDIREMTGALTTVVKHCSYAGDECTLALARKVLGAHSKDERTLDITLKDVIREVCEYFDITRDTIFSDSRSRPTVAARHIAIYLCNKYIKNLSLGELALVFKNSRPAILYAGNRITRAVKANDPTIKPAVTKLIGLIEAKY
ncbi:MAG: DnaA/Hda family protein [Planctomycetota bacterium]